MRGTRACLWSLPLLLAAAAAGCASGGQPAPGQWARVYPRSFERVWQATLTTLAESGYSIEDQDREQGYIRAESGERDAYRRMVLEVFVVRRPESVRVDVQASGGAVSSPADVRRLSRPVLAFLDALDVRLRG